VRTCFVHSVSGNTLPDPSCNDCTAAAKAHDAFQLLNDIVELCKEAGYDQEERAKLVKACNAAIVDMPDCEPGIRYVARRMGVEL
jgi:hypothetical protein